MDRTIRISEILRACVEDGVWAGGVLGIVRPGAPAILIPHGRHEFGGGRRVRADAIFDLASLTKVVGTTTVAMRLAEAGVLSLDDPIGDVLPEFVECIPAQRRLRQAVTVRHLLTHASGLPAYVPLHQRPDLRGLARREAILAVPLSGEPGSQTTYSDIGFLILGFFLERVGGLSLDALVATEVAQPLGLLRTRFCPPPAWRSRILPTERVGPGERLIRGRVHDENAHWLGGVAGHAGLFSCMDDLCQVARMLISTGDCLSGRFLSAATVRALGTPVGMVPGSSRCIGWDSPTENCSGGAWMRPGSFGHTGFTGTSMWMDPAAELAVILLTNGVYPRRETRVQRGFFKRRRRVHEAVYEALGLAPC